MNIHNPDLSPATLAEVVKLIEGADLPPTRRRDMVSAITRICDMAGCSPMNLQVDVPALRKIVAKILPAAHGISAKTFANQKSLFGAALELAGVIDPMPRGIAKADPLWGPLVSSISHDKRLACGLAAFANWCSLNSVHPEAVTDAHVQQFLQWLEARTLCPKPRDVVRRVPNIWNDARHQAEGWPQIELTPLSFRAPSEHLKWTELAESFRQDVDAYLAMRANPDLFDERPNAPRGPLRKKTLHQQSEHIRLAASVLVRNGTPVEEIMSLADLVEPEAFKTVLRHYHDQAGGKPNAFAIGISKTMIQVAKHHVGASQEHIERLKALAAKLPAVPFDLTEKNKALLRQFESKRLQARLFFLPEELMGEAADSMDKRRFLFVDAQVAIAVDIALVAPLRPQNMIALAWNRHFSEPDGAKGRLLLHIPAEETKTKKRELVFELPEDLAHRLRWYRRHILPRLKGDLHGALFVTEKGTNKAQKTLTDQIIERIERHVGVHVTPHQFRHLAAKFYLDKHPEDFRTVTDLLGHADAKTTLIYAGLSSQRASRAYGKIVIDQRDALKLKRPRRKKK